MLEDILSKYSFPKRTPARQDSIEKIEEKVGFKLPGDYAYYLLHYAQFEDFVGPEYVRLWDVDELISNNEDYAIFTLPKTIGIGTNGGGEFLAIEFITNDQYRIVLSPFIDLDSQYHIEIGHSFTDFLARLDMGKEWFN